MLTEIFSRAGTKKLLHMKVMILCGTDNDTINCGTDNDTTKFCMRSLAS